MARAGFVFIGGLAAQYSLVALGVYAGGQCHIDYCPASVVELLDIGFFGCIVATLAAWCWLAMVAGGRAALRAGYGLLLLLTLYVGVLMFPTTPLSFYLTGG